MNSINLIPFNNNQNFRKSELKEYSYSYNMTSFQGKDQLVKSMPQVNKKGLA